MRETIFILTTFTTVFSKPSALLNSDDTIRPYFSSSKCFSRYRKHRVKLLPCEEDNQYKTRWQIEDYANGTFKIRTKFSSKFLTNYDGKVVLKAEEQERLD